MNTKYAIVVAIVAIAIILGSVAAYIYLSQPSASAPSITLQGAGATFPYPLLNSIITNYSTNVKPNVQVNYQPIGSGGGISATNNRKQPWILQLQMLLLQHADTANVPNALHIPETIGAVTVAYNLPGVSSGLHLTGQVHRRYFPRQNNNVE